MELEIKKQALRDAVGNASLEAKHGHGDFQWRAGRLPLGVDVPAVLVALPEAKQHRIVTNVGVPYIYASDTRRRYTLPEFLNEHQ